jgi:hypothetical protein
MHSKMTRLVLAFVACLTITACDEHGSGGPPPDGGHETGLTAAPGGGFCCPIDQPTCNCFRNGGWIAHQTDTCGSVCDLAPTNATREPDDHGCEVLTGPNSCLDFDAGVPDAAQ